MRWFRSQGFSFSFAFWTSISLHNGESEDGAVDFVSRPTTAATIYKILEVIPLKCQGQSLNKRLKSNLFALSSSTFRMISGYANSRLSFDYSFYRISRWKGTEYKCISSWIALIFFFLNPFSLFILLQLFIFCKLDSYTLSFRNELDYLLLGKGFL